jgi:O-methyltransferase involved in polyketide biosynthesis
MARLCAPGGRVVFDYVPEPVISGKVSDPVARASFKHTAKLGEPFLFGLDPGGTGPYLARFGFRLVSQFDPETLRRLYGGADRAPVGFMNIAVCERTGEPPTHST